MMNLQQGSSRSMLIFFRGEQKVRQAWCKPKESFATMLSTFVYVMGYKTHVKELLLTRSHLNLVSDVPLIHIFEKILYDRGICIGH